MRQPVTRMKRDKDLRKHYMMTLQSGLILSLTIFIIIFKVKFKTEEAEIVQVIEQEEIAIEEVIQTKQIETPPPPPRPPVPVEVPNDEIIEDDVIDIDTELDFDAAIDLPAPPPAAEEEEDEEQIFVVVEKQPELIGGIAAVQKKIRYPELARKAGIEGRVIVQFVVDENGSVQNPVVVRGIGAGCDEEALRAVSTAKFKPGLQRGRPVKVRYSLPVTFALTGG